MALRDIRRATSDTLAKRRRTILVGAVLLSLVVSGLCLAQSMEQRGFGSPEEAVQGLISALRSKDLNALMAILGPECDDIVSSGDPIADGARRERFVQLYQETHLLQEKSADRVFLNVGKENWPFPIPIVRKDSLWYFDADEGREELLARRIGRNELSAIQVCQAVVDAQREYASMDRNGDGLREYAQHFRSHPGKKDGLYWEAKEGDKQSPLGPLLAEAQEEGYAFKQSDSRPSPYHGYYYRMLTAQGENAPGGAYDYVVKGKMLGGFALVAYPAQYGASGIMTFMANHDGIVYQKDLGEDTTKAAQAMSRFNPDGTWQKAIASYAKAGG